MNIKRKVPVGIGIPLDLLEKIDAERGDKSRSVYVVELLQKRVEEATAQKRS